MSDDKNLPKQSYDNLVEYIEMSARRAGFDLVGVVGTASSLAMTKENGKLDEWAENGYCADMKWFADTVEKRKDILKVMPDAKNVICVAMNYYSDTDNASKEKSVGKIARYARGRDYHKIFDKKLKLFAQKLKEIFPEGEFKYYSDTGPVLERAWAARAGLGFVGKNTNLITKYGSWVLLGEIITNIDLGLDSCLRGNDNGRDKNNIKGGCGDCGRCLDACPTEALIVPYTVDARKCISYLTIEYKGEIPIELREKMGNRIFGCDACQEVCPFNIGRQKEAENELAQKVIAGSAKSLREILSIKTDEEFLNKFAGSPLMRAKRRGLVRNACIAAGNSGNESLLPYLKECLKDKEPIIASHAKWAIKKIEKMIK